MLLLVFILWDLYTTRSALLAGLQAYILGAYVAVGSAVNNYFPARFIIRMINALVLVRPTRMDLGLSWLWEYLWHGTLLVRSMQVEWAVS